MEMRETVQLWQLKCQPPPWHPWLRPLLGIQGPLRLQPPSNCALTVIALYKPSAHPVMHHHHRHQMQMTARPGKALLRPLSLPVAAPNALIVVLVLFDLCHAEPQPQQHAWPVWPLSPRASLHHHQSGYHCLLVWAQHHQVIQDCAPQCCGLSQRVHFKPVDAAWPEYELPQLNAAKGLTSMSRSHVCAKRHLKAKVQHCAVAARVECAQEAKGLWADNVMSPTAQAPSNQGQVQDNKSVGCQLPKNKQDGKHHVVCRAAVLASIE